MSSSINIFYNNNNGYQNTYQKYNTNEINYNNTDPVNFCVQSQYFSNLNASDSMQNLNKCSTLFSERCSRNWDTNCDAFISMLDSIDFSRDSSSNLIKNTASNKYCRNEKNFSNCQVENNIINCTLTNNLQLQDISENIQNLKKLNTVAPVSTNNKKVCDVINLNNLDNNDRVLNECLDRGICQDIITEISRTTKLNNIEIKNDRLKQFISYYIYDEPTNFKEFNNYKPGLSTLGGYAPTISYSPNKGIQGLQKYDDLLVNLPIIKNEINTDIGPKLNYTISNFKHIKPLPTTTLPTTTLPSELNISSDNLNNDDEENKIISSQFIKLKRRNNNIFYFTIVVLIILLLSKCFYSDKKE